MSIFHENCPSRISCKIRLGSQRVKIPSLLTSCLCCYCLFAFCNHYVADQPKFHVKCELKYWEIMNDMASNQV